MNLKNSPHKAVILDAAKHTLERFEDDLIFELEFSSYWLNNSVAPYLDGRNDPVKMSHSVGVDISIVALWGLQNKFSDIAQETEFSQKALILTRDWLDEQLY